MLPKSKIGNAAGQRNTFVVVEQATNAAPNDHYEVLPDFSFLCDRFAEAVPTTGREFQAAMATQPLLNSILKLPYDSITATITPRDRVKIGERILNIASVFNEGENNEKIVVWTMEKVAT